MGETQTASSPTRLTCCGRSSAAAGSPLCRSGAPAAACCSTRWPRPSSRPHVPGIHRQRDPQAGLRRPLRAAPLPGWRGVHVPQPGRPVLAGRRHRQL